MWAIAKKLIPQKVKCRIKRVIKKVNNLGKPKIFCIGRNKTGTTSVKRALLDWSYDVGNQREAEQLLEAYKKRDFREIAAYCKYYQAFQDAPFSFPYTFIVMDQFFPGSKFILTVRDNSEQWYNSLVNFDSKKYAGGQIPTAEDLNKAEYNYPGYLLDVITAVYNTPKEHPYKKDLMIKNYERHNELVKEYFKERSDDLLVINVADIESYNKLATFLNKDPLYEKMPWENRTKSIIV